MEKDMGFIFKSNMYRLQIIQDRALRLVGEYDWYTRMKQLHSDNKILILKEYIKVLALKLYASARFSRNRYIQK